MPKGLIHRSIPAFLKYHWLDVMKTHLFALRNSFISGCEDSIKISVIRFLLLPKTVLKKPMKGSKGSRNRILQNQLEVLSSLDILPDSFLPDTQDAVLGTPNKVIRAEQLISEGYFSRASAVLTSQDFLLHSEDNASLLTDLHPLRPDEEFPSARDITPLEVSPISLIRTIKKSCNLSAPDLFGWTAEMLQPILDDDDAIDCLTFFLQHMMCGNLPSCLNDVLLSSRIIALDKNPGIRPISIGNLFVKLVSKIGCSMMSQEFENHFGDLQFGIGQSAGCEKIIHHIRRHYNQDKTILTLDFKNAFNSVFRHAALSEVRQHFDLLYPFLHWAYSPESQLLWQHGMDIKYLKSSSGCRQGDPLAPLIFCIAIHPILKYLRSKFPSLDIYAEMDDVYLVGDDDVISQCYEEMKGKFSAETGLELRSDKCYILTKNPDSTLSQILGLPLANGGGMRVLGSPVIL